ncbi:hypothetical protein O181_007858 [Austropuccinia psidii MF-1]|uniref:Reverse transcriptase RNase H-like domain-containing protein n=1 Tax=Austropuccinia psidii MF-1 TaxID=1389203 RepID=A0A9Q3GI02_9BASI|nr:hypothetical protein [Austropuccinia psidii MF-1]
MLPDFEIPFKLYIKSSFSKVLGTSLHQRQIVDVKPRKGGICYISRNMKTSKARYEEAQTECLFLVWALERLHYYLEGSVLQFEAYTDCTALRSLLKMNKTNSKMLRWQIEIQEYRCNIKIIYKEGRICTNADGLSRWKLDNVKSNPVYDPEVNAKVPVNFIEVEMKDKFIFSAWEPECGTLKTGNDEPEKTETPVLGISSSRIHTEIFNALHKSCAKHKQCSILTSLLQQKYRS